MKIIFAAIALMFCMNTQAVEFDNSLGFGFQYGGVLGWQGSVSTDNVHGRIALGLIGASVGADVNINNYTSLGFTLTQIDRAQIRAVSVNYYFSGEYTEGWRAGLDIGSATKDSFQQNEGNFVSISIGYSFN